MTQAHGSNVGRMGRLWEKTREHASNAVIGGGILVLTGFTPEHWVAELAHILPERVRAVWPALLDGRLLVLTAGVTIVVGDLMWRRHRSSALAPSPATGPSATGPAGAAAKMSAMSRDTHSLTDKPSIAVLPFANMSGDKDQDYFADGMVEEVITGLSRIKWLSVISRNSSFIYKNKPAAAKEVADELGVRYVVEGGVRKSGNRVRISARLIDAGTGAQLWADQYDRLLEEVFAMQDEITMNVVGAIEPSLRKAEIERVKRQRPSNLNAYDLVLRALPFITGKPKDAAEAIPLLESALKLEPDYGAAHAFLSFSYHILTYRMREDGRTAAIHHAHAAIGRGNDDATALATAAFVIALQEHDTALALKLFDRALELSSSNVVALGWSAIILAWLGKTEPAIERAHSTLRLSPFDPLNFRPHFALSIAYFHLQRYAAAADEARNALDINPGFSLHLGLLAAALLRLGRLEEAKAAARAILECEPSFSIRGTALIVELEPAVFRPVADAWRELGLPE